MNTDPHQAATSSTGKAAKWTSTRPRRNPCAVSSEATRCNSSPKPLAGTTPTSAAANPTRKTVRRECLDRLLLISRRHTERVLLEYVCHYNEQRPHRGIDLAVPVATHSSDAPAFPTQVERRDVLGGLIHEYYEAAA